MDKTPNVLQMHSDNVEASYFDIFRIKKIFHSEIFFDPKWANIT